MKKFIIRIICLFFLTSCSYTVTEKYDVLIVTGCSNTNIKEGITTYKISAYDSDGYCWSNVIKYRAKLGIFEIGDTVMLIKK